MRQLKALSYHVLFCFIVSDPLFSIWLSNTVKTRRAIEKVLPGMGDIDVDLELDETDVRR